MLRSVAEQQFAIVRMQFDFIAWPPLQLTPDVRRNDHCPGVTTA